MDNKEFRKFCHEEFKKRGFKKVKTIYFLDAGKGILCGLYIDHSQFGPECGVSYFYYIDYDSSEHYPSYYEKDLIGYIKILSKEKSQRSGEYYMTDFIHYLLYNREELLPYFEKAFDELILPPVYKGKDYLAANMNHLFCAWPLKREDVLKKLIG